jgi:hypothetical protein
MLTVVKNFLKALLIPSIYTGGFLVSIISLFKEARWGLFVLVFIIPQPNIYYKLHQYFLGKDFLDIIFISVFLGIFIQKKGFAKTKNTGFIFLFILYSYLSLWNSALTYSLELPISTSNIFFIEWKNYIQMICYYFLVLNIIKDEKQQKILVIIITIVILLISIRCFRNFSPSASFSYDRRVGGPFEAVGLGSNHLGAFIADYCSVVLGLFLFEKNWKLKILYLLTVLFGIHPLFFSYSRGAYGAAFLSIIVIGLLKKRSLLIGALVIIISWKAILPVTVVERINMTTDQQGNLESSAAKRIDLWEYAEELFMQNPAVGIGYGGFGISRAGEELQDTHNYYVKVLCEEEL